MNLAIPRSGSIKAQQFQESIIREMSRLAAKCGAVNLGQGVPDFPCPLELKEAAAQALVDDINQYAITWGDRLLREAIAEKTLKTLGVKVNPEAEITVTCGATEAMVAVILALVDPGDEIIVLEPFYENYGPDAILAGASPRYVALHPPEWTIDENELEAAFSNKTRAIIVNSPNNPTGRVFSKDELNLIARLCQKWGVLAICDEIYEHILYDGAQHMAMCTLPGMEDLTVTINSLSKTYTLTGWRVGWAIAPADLTAPIRKVHDFLTVGAPAPLQRGGVKAIAMPQRYYDELSTEYAERRKHMLETLDLAGLPYFKPQGAYYVFSNISKFGFENDLAFTKHLVENVGVAVVPGSSFFAPSSTVKPYVRICFSRKLKTLELARQRLLNGQLKC